MENEEISQDDQEQKGAMREDDDATRNRRARLRVWFGAGPLPRKDRSYFAQLIRGVTPFGERGARRIEKEYEMPSGYLDMTLLPGEMGEGDEDADADAEQLSPTHRIANTNLMAANITLDEADIIRSYRKANEMGKSLIRAAAQTASRHAKLT